MKYFKKPAFFPKGFTIIEFVVVVALMTIMIGLFIRGVRVVKQVLGVEERLDLSNRIRNASYYMSKELSFSTEFLFPPKSESVFRDHLIFRNNVNEVIGVFLSKEGLMTYNYNQDKAKCIFREAAKFECRLVDQDLIEYRLKVTRNQYEFTLWNQLSTMNTIP